MNRDKKIRLPYGTCSYNYLIEQGYHYVDRTKYIEILEGLNEKYILFIRPRRFGKSLFVSILDYYYNILHKDKFEQYFGKYYIGKNPTKGKNSYLILNLDFSGIRTDTKENAEAGFLENIRLSVKKFLIYYKDILNISENVKANILSKNNAEILIQYFLTEVETRNKKNLYILIDEYDHFANELLSFNTTVFEEITTETGFVRKFYEKLKEGAKTVIDRIFITGVSPITLDSLTSGFNITKNISVQEQFNEMFGFTKEETLFLIKETIKDCPKLKTEDIFNELKKLYDGYLFNKDATERMFNSDMVLYYLTEIHYCKKPEKVVDKNFASDYSKIKKLFHICDNKKNYEVLKEIVYNQKVTGKIVDEFSLTSFERNELLSLLYYTGILTIKESDLADIIFRIPNYVIKELYYEYFIVSLANELNYQLDTEEISSSIRLMAKEGNITEFIKVVEKILKVLSNRDYMNFSEKYIKAIIITYLTLSKIYYIRSEAEFEKRYLDITCIGKDIYNIKHHWIMELKYIKKENSENEFESKKTEALKQLQNYNLKENITGELHKTALIFIGEKCSFISVDGKTL